MGNKIVFINQSSGYLMVDIINEFENTFNERVLITGSLFERETKLDESVKIKKIIPYNKRNLLFRALTWTVGLFQIYFTVLFKYRNAYLFFVTNPPLIVFIPLITKNKFSILIYDIYPDTLYRFGRLKETSWIVKLWDRANKIAFNKADNVFTISQSMKNLLARTTNPAKVKVVPIWAEEPHGIHHEKGTNQFLVKYNLQNKFIVLYSGNLGLTHDIEPLIEVARECRNPDIFFLIIGNGEKEEKIRKMIQGYNLSNCMWLPLQPIDMLPFTIGGSDLCVVSTGKGGGDLSIPSKAFTLLAVGKPILSIADQHAELSILTNNYAFGKAFSSGQVSEMCAFINQLYSSKETYDQFCLNAKRAAQNFTRANAQKFRDALK
jgi:hypothetical protein